MEPSALRTVGFTESGDPGSQQSPPRENPASSRVLDTEMRGSVMMELIVDKLKLLKYERQFCNSRSLPWPRLHKFYFALPSANRNEQFLYFSTMAAWLFGLLGCQFAPPSEVDDPNVTCSKIMMELMALGFEAPNWPPARLKQGHGDAVCTVLDTLCSLVLDAIKYEFTPVTHFHQDDPLPATTAAAPSDGAHNDRSELYIPDDDDQDTADATPRGTVDPQPSHDQTLTHSELANKWKLDLERIAPHLRIVVVDDGNDWRAHLDRAAKLYDDTASRFGAGKSQLKRLEATVTASLEKLESHENFVNQQLETLISEFVAVKGRLQGVQERYDHIGEVMGKLAAEHAQVLDALEQVRAFLLPAPLCKVHVQENSEIEQSYWSRAENWTQRTSH